MQRSHTCTIYFDSPELTIQSVKASLQEDGLFVKESTGALFVRWSDQGPELKVIHRAGADVRVEAAAIGLSTEYEDRLLRCHYAFDIEFNDLNAVLDEVNTLIQVQHILLCTSEGVAFNSWNSALSGEA